MDPFQRQQGLEAERQTEMMLKTFRGILNKLTPKKFEALMKRVDGLSINSENRLKAVIKLIVDKAVVDHSCSIYAEMCHHMKKLMVMSQRGVGPINFRQLLMRQCQMEFQNNELLKEQAREMAAAQNETQHQQLMQEQTNHKAHERLLGIVRFIGELFKLNMVHVSVIHSCAVTLIQDERDVTLECLCKLLSMVGEGLDTEAERPSLNKYFGYICQFLRDERMSVRMRCVLMDVYELRKNNWVPRRQEEAPKTNMQLPQDVKPVGKREQPHVAHVWQQIEPNQEGGRDADRMADGKEKISSNDCGGNKKQLGHSDSSSTHQPPQIKGILKTGNVRAREKKHSVSFQDETGQAENQPNFASRMTVEQGKSLIHSDGDTQEESPLPETHLELKVKEDCDEGEVSMSLKTLLQENLNNKDVEDWIQNNLNEKQRSSEEFVRALMCSVGESVVDTCVIHKLDGRKMLQRSGLLRKYIVSDQQQLVALNALKELVDRKENPRLLLRWFFDLLLDEDIIQDAVFLKWKSSTDTDTLAAVNKFFALLQKA